ncbi:MAG: cupin domain-containing protein [Candidatus Heimdallarchaeota archaeon]|nr:cupin domain-containing protein [Candidatus Heimdallarchaeota archaeon]
MEIRDIIKEFLEGKHTKSQDNTEIIELEKNNDYSLAYGELKPGEKNRKHKMQMREIYYFLEGEGIIEIEGEQEKISAGKFVIIPKNAVQWLRNTGEKSLRFLMIVNPPYDQKKEEILE